MPPIATRDCWLFDPYGSGHINFYGSHEGSYINFWNKNIYGRLLQRFTIYNTGRDHKNIYVWCGVEILNKENILLGFGGI